MHVSVGVTGVKGSGASDFLKNLPTLIKTAKTWTLEKHSPAQATVASTATITATRAKPRFTISEEFAASVKVSQVDAKDWSDEEQVLALGHLVYLFMTAFKSYTTKITIEP
jgi:hypothetical protein